MTVLMPALCPACKDVVLVENFTSTGPSSFSVSPGGVGLHVHGAEGLTVRGAVIRGGLIVGGPLGSGQEPGADAAANDVLLECPQCGSAQARVLPGLYDLVDAVASIVAAPDWTWARLNDLHAILVRAHEDDTTQAQILEAVQASNAQVGLLLMQGSQGWSRGDVLGALGLIVSIAAALFPYFTG